MFPVPGPLIVVSAALLAAGGGAAPVCTLPEPVKIIVEPRTADLVYDHSRSMAALQGQQLDTINPYGFDGVAVTQGFMEGAIAMRPSVKLDYRLVAGARAACVFYDTIKVEISITPRITVASEVWGDPCMRRAVIDHEMKHVMTDRRIINKYGRVMGERLHRALAERGFIAGPMHPEDMEAVARRMQQVVFQILEHEYKKMALERAEAQQAVDSREEYDRVSALCPDFKAPQGAADAARTRGW
jgi:hypothetical protein